MENSMGPNAEVLVHLFLRLYLDITQVKVEGVFCVLRFQDASHHKNISFHN